MKAEKEKVSRGKYSNDKYGKAYQTLLKNKKIKHPKSQKI